MAVLGILAINVAGFAGPRTGVSTPCFLTAPDGCERTAYAVSFLVFEGKMRTLFALLFGAGIGIYRARLDQDDFDADLRQIRRLFWLMAFGALHYLLLWWGDILFVYAWSGLIVLMLAQLPSRALVALALTLALTMAAWNVTAQWPMALAEEQVRLGTASGVQLRHVEESMRYLQERNLAELALYRADYWTILRYKLLEEPLWLFEMLFASVSEIVPVMLLGLCLQRSGFFAGNWPRRRLLGRGLAALALGVAMTGLALAWLLPRGFPFNAMVLLLSDGLIAAHVLMALGYAALLVAARKRMEDSAFGTALAAAGRMAFSNYIASSLLMCAIFYGWGFGLFGRVGPDHQWPFVLGVWGLILCWSPWWLARFRRGPLEWAWRSLVEGERLANRPTASRG